MSHFSCKFMKDFKMLVKCSRQELQDTADKEIKKNGGYMRPEYVYLEK